MNHLAKKSGAKRSPSWPRDFFPPPFLPQLSHRRTEMFTKTPPPFPPPPPRLLSGLSYPLNDVRSLHLTRGSLQISRSAQGLMAAPRMQRYAREGGGGWRRGVGEWKRGGLGEEEIPHVSPNVPIANSSCACVRQLDKFVFSPALANGI